MNLVLIGAANPDTARIINAVQSAQPEIEILGFLDNDPAKKDTQFIGYPVLGGLSALDTILGLADDIHFVNLITGSTQARFETSRHLAQRGCRFANLIHPSVDTSLTKLGTGNYFQQGAMLQAAVTVGNNSSIHMNAIVAHESTIGHSVFVAMSACISGCVRIDDGTFVGVNATVLPRIHIGKWATIGAGAVVTRDVPDYATVVGSPARIVKTNPSLLQSGDIFAN